MLILLIEDDQETTDFLTGQLASAGFEVKSADNGLDGLRLAGEIKPDLMIVDRMIPKLSGMAVVQAIRADDKDTPIIFLTAMSSVSDRVEGLEAGADDYLVKPFATEELVARINALTRRPIRDRQDMTFTIRDLTINRLTREVTRGGSVIALQPREYQLLEYLAKHVGQFVTRKMMLEDIWDFQFDPGTNIVESHLSRLRAKIDINNTRPLIKTVRGSGYILDDQ